jgi:2-phosphosulfolactate phosphatase
MDFDFRRTDLESCTSATGLVVVIDVLRAFSTAGYAFRAGAKEIWLVSSIQEALEIQDEIPGSLTMGEVDGLPIEGFNFGNSPPQFDGIDLSGRSLIQRTTSGTQGAVLCENGDPLLAASFCNAEATLKHITNTEARTITYLLTGMHPGGWGDEDAACADYLEARLRNQEPDIKDLLSRVKNSRPGRMFLDPERPEFPLVDLEYCLAVDRFDFSMPIERKKGRLRMVHEHTS